MAIKNPAFGAYLTDDDPADRVNEIEVVDAKINVELEALKNASKIKTPGYPCSSGKFSVTRTKPGDESVITIVEGRVKTVWTSPPGPCMNDDRWHELCDGLVPSCEPYKPVSKKDAENGYSPTGCKAFRSCQRTWKKKAIYLNDNAQGDKPSPRRAQKW